MTTFLWNVASGASQFRAVLVPWLERKGPATFWCCSRTECFSSSSQFPVRYIPDKSLKANGLGNGFHERELDGASEGSALKNTNHLRKQLRGETSLPFYDGLHQEVQEFDCSIGQSCEPTKPSEEISDRAGIRLRNNMCELNTEAVSSMEDAEKFVIGLLARRAYTAAELRKKLLGQRFSLETVELVMTDIKSRGLINDSLYAETYSQSRWSSSSWGPRRIKQALFKKGVSTVDAENAVKLVFQDGESGHQETALGMSQNSMDQLLAQASKKWLQSRDKPEEKRKARIVRWLQYRGHSWSVTSFVLKKLQSMHPP